MLPLYGNREGILISTWIRIIVFHKYLWVGCTESRAGPWDIESHAESYINQSINSKRAFGLEMTEGNQLLSIIIYTEPRLDGPKYVQE